MRPGYTALQCIDQNAIILQILTQVRVCETPFFPGFGHARKAEFKSLVFPENPAHFAVHIAAKGFLAIGEAKHQALLHWLITQLLQKCIGNAALDVILFHHDIGFFGIRNAENRGVTEFALHHFPAGSLGVFPVVKHVAEALTVLRLPVTDTQSDICEDAKTAFSTHHHLVEIRSGGCPGMRAGLENSNRRDIFLVNHDVFDFSVIGGVLPCSTGDHPAAYTGVLKGLRKMPDRVVALGSQFFDRVLEQILQLWPPHAGFDRDRLVNFV